MLRRTLCLLQENPTYSDLFDVGWDTSSTQFSWRKRRLSPDERFLPIDDEEVWESLGPERLEILGICRLAFFHAGRPDRPVLLVDGASTKSSAVLQPATLQLHLTLRTPLVEPTAPQGDDVPSAFKAAAERARQTGTDLTIEGTKVTAALRTLLADEDAPGEPHGPEQRHEAVARVEAPVRTTSVRQRLLTAQVNELRELGDSFAAPGPARLHLWLDAARQAGHELAFVTTAVVAPHVNARFSRYAMRHENVSLATFPDLTWDWQTDGRRPRGVPLAERLGIPLLLPERRHWSPGPPMPESLSLHWLRRLGVGFARGPDLRRLSPGGATPPTMELVFTREIHPASPVWTQGPLPLWLEPAGNPEPGDQDENDTQRGVPVLRLVQRQPPRWCAEEHRAGEPLRFALAIEGIGARALVRIWDEVLSTPYHRALDLMRGDRPISLLPRLAGLYERRGSNFRRLDETAPGPNDPTWTALFRLTDRGPTDTAAVDPDALTLDLVHLAPGDLDRLWQPAPSGELLASFVLERFRTTDGAPLERHARLQATPESEDDSTRAFTPLAALGPEPVPVPLVELAITEAGEANAAAEAPRIQLGAFALELPAHGDFAARGGEGAPGRLAIWPGRPPATPPFGLDLEWPLRLQGFQPVAQDPPLAGVLDGQSPAILIPPRAAPGAFELRLEEITFRRDTREPTAQRLQLRVSGGAIPRQTIRVLDPGPFLVAEIDFPALTPDDTDQTLATFATDGIEPMVWQIRATRSGYHLRLPPQGIAETTLRPGMAAEQGHADFRYAPPADVTLFTTFRRDERALVEPPTNTRRLFGDASQRAPGAPLETLDAELLYGMPVRVTDRKDLHLAELTADFGFLPPPLDRPRGDADFHTNWRDVHLAFAHRLAVLALRPVGSSAMAVIEGGVAYRLRPDADTRRPVPEPGPATRRHSPQRPKNGIGDGIEGGALWGFGSVEVYESLWRRPHSDHGQLGNLALTALGGYAEQRASFDNRRTTIAAQTALGRTHLYMLERVGRIGAFWNRAKHVVVFERSVEPAAQFAGRAPDAIGRPYLRKVSEFVEILEAERRYPEFGEPAAACGAVRGIVFRSTVIPVDTAWGEDLPGQGWRVPLWDRASGAERPAVYPKPQIDLVIATDPATGAPETATALLEPEQLCFFTSTDPDLDDDTDTWPALEGVDYADVPSPTPPDLATHHAADLDALLPEAASVEGGLAAFTFAIEPAAERPADLMSGRNAAAMVASLANVTMMRAAPAAVATGDVAETRRLAAEATRLRASVETVTGGLRAELEALRGRPAAELEAGLRRLRAEAGKLAQSKQVKQARDAVDALGKRDLFKADPCALLQAAAARALDAAHGRLEREIGALMHLLEAELDAILAAGGDQRAALRAALADRFAALHGLLQSLRQPFLGVAPELRRLADARLAALVAQAVKALRQRLHQEVEQGGPGLQRALDGLEAELGAALDAALDRAIASLARHLPKAAISAREAARSARAELAKAMARARDALAKAEPLDAVFQRLEADAGKAAEGLDAALAGPQVALRELTQEIAAAVARRENELIALERALDDLLGKPDLPSRQQLMAPIGSARASLLGAIGADGELRRTVLEGVRTRICSAWGGSFGELQQAAADLLSERLGAALEKALEGDALDTIIGAVERFGSDAAAGIDAVVGRALDGLKESLGGVALGQSRSSTLRLLRAFGEAPTAPSLAFNRRRIAYYFDQVSGMVGTTPMTALVDRLGDELKPFGLRLPVDQLGGRLMPRLPEAFGLAELLPDLAGLKLDALLARVRLPQLKSDQLTVEHKVDPDTRRAWIEAHVDVPLGRTEPILDVGPVRLALAGGRLTARARIDGGIGERVERTSTGRIDGDWQMSVGGQELVAFVDTPLRYEEGRVRFDIAPERVRLTGALRFLEELMRRLGSQGGGLSIQPIIAKGLPVGIACRLEILLPPMQGGVFGISGLVFGAGLSLRALDDELKLDFAIGLTFNLGEKTRPFVITVYLLGGAGWVTTNTVYRPLRRELVTEVEIAIAAAAAIAFAFGPLQGDVNIALGIQARFVTGTGGSNFAVTVFLLARGRVSVRRIVSLCIHLLLEVTIERGGRVEGRGEVRAVLRISRFFKIRVRQRIHYVFAKGKGESEAMAMAVSLSSLAEDRFLVPARAYVTSLA